MPAKALCASCKPRRGVHLPAPQKTPPHERFCPQSVAAIKKKLYICSTNHQKERRPTNRHQHGTHWSRPTHSAGRPQVLNKHNKQKSQTNARFHSPKLEQNIDIELLALVLFHRIPPNNSLRENKQTGGSRPKGVDCPVLVT